MKGSLGQNTRKRTGSSRRSGGMVASGPSRRHSIVLRHVRKRQRLSGSGLGNINDMVINLDIYYRGLAADHIQQLADRLLRLSQEAECADAHRAAFHLADAATQLLDMGTEVNWQHTTGPEPGLQPAARSPRLTLTA